MPIHKSPQMSYALPPLISVPIHHREGIEKKTLKSFRHSYGIRRVYETNGNIFQVAMEMGHKNTNTTLLYLRFQQDEIKQYFPSLIPYIERREKKEKSTTMVTKSMVIQYSNVNKLHT